MSASAKKPWKRFIKRDMLQGGGRGKKGKPFFRGEAAYVRRLRRLELVTLVTYGKLKLPAEVLDRMLGDMIEMKDVVEPKPGRGGEDGGDEVPIPHAGPADGEAEGASDPEG